MTAPAKTVLQLTEYVPVSFPPEAIPEALGVALYCNYSSQVAVEPPSFKTDYMWGLTSQGWVGYIPLSPELGLELKPAGELGNLFRMLEYAYRLKSFRFLEGLIGCRSLPEFYERLANVLARRVLDRGRQGFYRAYTPRTEQLPYVRGRLDMRQVIRKPWDIGLHCHYEEHTADTEENQILAWTLFVIARSGMCTERVLPTVRRAYHALRGFASVEPRGSRDCVGRLYNRLNDDYQSLHALCRFFLEHSGPSHETGDRTVLPFLVNMKSLYQLFVAEWLRIHLPQGLLLKVQEKVDIGAGRVLSFVIDLVVCDAGTGAALCVLDTKYKYEEKPGPDDVVQVVAYAEVEGCQKAALIYPAPVAQPLDEHVGKIRVQSMVFSLQGDLEAAGQAFVQDLLSSCAAQLR